MGSKFQISHSQEESDLRMEVNTNDVRKYAGWKTRTTQTFLEWQFAKREGGWSNADSIAESIICDFLTFYWTENWKQDFAHW